MEQGHGCHVDFFSTTQGTEDILCPFFLAHGVREIHCEAYEEQCRSIMRYRCSENKREHMKTYCKGRYAYCEHYRGLMREKYDEEV